MTISFERYTKGPIVRSAFLTNGWYRDHSANPNLTIFGGNVLMHFRGISNGNPSSMGVWSAPLETFNGENWNKNPVANPVLTAGGVGSPDEHGIQDPCIVALPSQLLLYYMGTYTGSGPSVIMRAESSDGLSWDKTGIVNISGGGNLTGGTPMAIVGPDGLVHLFYTKGRGGSGALNGWEYYKRVSTDASGTVFGAETFAFGVSGVSGTFDSFSIITARVWKDEDDPYWYVFYGGGSSDDDYPEGFGVLRSLDLSTWERTSANPVFLRGPTGTWDEGALWSGAVIRANGQLFMAYEGVGSAMTAGGAESDLARDVQYGGYNVTSFSQIGLALDRGSGSFSDWFPNTSTLPMGKYYIRNMLTGKFLAPSAIPPVDSTPTMQVSANEIENAQWLIEPSNGFYRISSASTESPNNHVLEIAGGSRRNVAPGVTYQLNGLQNQQWKLVRVGEAENGNGHYEIVNRYSGQCLEIFQSRTADKARALQMPSIGWANQRWEIIRAETS